MLEELTIDYQAICATITIFMKTAFAMLYSIDHKYFRMISFHSYKKKIYFKALENIFFGHKIKITYETPVMILYMSFYSSIFSIHS